VNRLRLVVVILTLLLLTACQQVANTRSQACDAMREVPQQVADMKTAVIDSQPVRTVGELRATVTAVRGKIQTAQNVSSAVKNSDNTLQMLRALEQMEAEMQGVPAETPASELKDKLGQAATAASDSAAALYDAVCAAK
jgi:hypothetical protein